MYQVYKNIAWGSYESNFVADMCFLKQEKAIEYIDSKPGAWGPEKQWSKVKGGDWYIVEVEVIE